MIKSRGNRIWVYYTSKYPFNQDVLVKGVLLYQGSINNCPKDLLEDSKSNLNFKFVRVWEI